MRIPWVSKQSRETGQVLVLFVAGIAAFLGLVGLSVDVGQLVFARTDLQKAADAAVFAAAQDLPSSTDATTTAEQFVADNASSASVSDVQVSTTYSPNDTVRVEASRDVEYVFLKVLGLGGHTVTADATARIGYYSGGSGILPFGFIASNDNNSTLLQNSCYEGQEDGVPTFSQNTPCRVKYGAGSNSGGDFGALSLGGNGADIYRSNIANGSSEKFKKGDQVPSETGDMAGPTRQGLRDRMNDPAPATCPGFDRDDILTTDDDGNVSIRGGCEDHPRIGIIPVVDKIDNPDVSTILGFAFVYLEDDINGQGGQAGLDVEFLSFVWELPGGTYDGTEVNDASKILLIE